MSLNFRSFFARTTIFRYFPFFTLAKLVTKSDDNRQAKETKTKRTHLALYSKFLFIQKRKVFPLARMEVKG